VLVVEGISECVCLFQLQFNFVGRLLGPRGNSLKRVEAATECRVLIRGRGSIKDPSMVISISPVLFSVSSPSYCTV